MNHSEVIFKTYREVVEKIQHDNTLASNFLENSIISMVYGKEFGTDELNSTETYEYLFNLYTQPTEVFNSGLLKILKIRKILENGGEDAIKLQGLRKVYAVAKQMAGIRRTGWIIRNVPIAYQENDAMHIMQMFALANIYFKETNISNLDKKKIYEMILVHELGESIIGDIREGAPEHNTKHDAEKDAIKKIFSDLKSKEYFINLWENFENRKSEEASFVYQLDKIDPIIKSYILDEQLKRNDLFNDFYDYEDRRKTFKQEKIKELAYYLNNARLK